MIWKVPSMVPILYISGCALHRSSLHLIRSFWEVLVFTSQFMTTKHGSARRQAWCVWAWCVGDRKFNVASVFSVRTQNLQRSVLADGLAVIRYQNFAGNPLASNSGNIRLNVCSVSILPCAPVSTLTLKEACLSRVPFRSLIFREANASSRASSLTLTLSKCRCSKWSSTCEVCT